METLNTCADHKYQGRIACPYCAAERVLARELGQEAELMTLGALATAELPPCPEGHELYDFYVEVERIGPGKPTVEFLLLGTLPGLNAQHARRLYWANLPHQVPARLNASGVPIAKRRLKSKEELRVAKRDPVAVSTVTTEEEP